jgi:hypothetical protein
MAYRCRNPPHPKTMKVSLLALGASNVKEGSGRGRPYVDVQRDALLKPEHMIQREPAAIVHQPVVAE